MAFAELSTSWRELGRLSCSRAPCRGHLVADMQVRKKIMGGRMQDGRGIEKEICKEVAAARGEVLCAKVRSCRLSLS